MGVVLIEPSEWARRRQIIQEVRASSRLSGGESSADVQAVQDRWVDGEITLVEMHDLIAKLNWPDGDAVP